MMMLLRICGGAMKSDADWDSRVKAVLKAELKRRDVTYGQLAAELKKMGVEETPENIANKISRGKFTAVFLFQCLDAIGCKSIAVSID